MARAVEAVPEGAGRKRAPLLITVCVGTFIAGFDALVVAADRTAGKLGLEGFAQIGYSQVIPHHLAWTRFLTSDGLAQQLAGSELLICHAGMGLIGDGLRAGCRIVIMPRRGATTKHHPANDQLPFARLIAERYQVTLCLEPHHLEHVVARALAAPRPEPPPFASDIPNRIADFLAATR